MKLANVGNQSLINTEIGKRGEVVKKIMKEEEEEVSERRRRVENEGRRRSLRVCVLKWKKPRRLCIEDFFFFW